MPQKISQKNSTLAEYSTNSFDYALKKLNSSANGLSEAEAKKRLIELGHNIISVKKEMNVVLEFLSHFLSPLTLILLFAAGVSMYLGEDVDAIIIGVIVILSVTLDFFEEYKADKSVKKLIDSVRTTATVVRAGEKKEINRSDVCIGEVLFLNSGNLVPADARILSAKDFFVNQSALTGESFPCGKNELNVSAENTSSISGLANMVFAGTNVVSGTATAVVFRNGKDTEFGKIAATLSEASEKSEFEAGINNFGYLIMKIMIFLVLFIFLFNSIVHHKLFESFMFAVAIAVGITPELLPMIMSVTMAKGSSNMAKKGVIVKRLASIPDLGSMDVLCTDKTGTLTEDKIALVRYTDISGNSSDIVLEYAYINSSYQTGIRNPLDEAVLEFRKIGIEKYQKSDEIPFDFFRKRMSVVMSDSEGNGNAGVLITKGAPEEVFKCCTAYNCNNKPVVFDLAAQSEATKTYYGLSADGFRVLAIATKKCAAKNTYTKEDENELTLHGFISFLDPPKKDIKEVLSELNEAGVDVKVITGDNELVTKKICSEIGIQVKGIMLGKDIHALTDDALRERVERTTIFARFSPDEKNRIILALKANGHVVGYMGDGINDAPSLKTADVGVSVNNAVDVAKESADIVLTKKSLRVLKEGILEGRRAFGNTMKYIMMGVNSNFGNMFSAAGAVVFLPFLPMLPIQILLNNFIYDLSQITIPSDGVDEDWIKKPKRWNIKFIKKFMYTFGPISSLFDYITFFVLFFVLHASAPVFQTGWFLESLATQTFVVYIIRTKKAPFFESSPSKLLLISTLFCVAIGWIMPFTPLGEFFGFERLEPIVMVVIAGIVITYLITIEFSKRIFYRWNSF